MTTLATSGRTLRQELAVLLCGRAMSQAQWHAAEMQSRDWEQLQEKCEALCSALERDADTLGSRVSTMVENLRTEAARNSGPEFASWCSIIEGILANEEPK